MRTKEKAGTRKNPFHSVAMCRKLPDNAHTTENLSSLQQTIADGRKTSLLL